MTPRPGRSSAGHDVSPMLLVLAVTGAAAASVAGGAVSLSDAADGWQAHLNMVSQLSRNPMCRGPFVVGGWGDPAILVFTTIALALIGLTGWALLSTRLWGELTAALAIVPIFVLWLDAYAVSQSPSGDCDAVGLGGWAGVAITRAGWCCVVASTLCGIAWAWLASRMRKARPEAWNNAA